MSLDLPLATLDEIRQANAELPDAIVRTPILRSEDLSERLGTPLFFKTENFQVTGAYKARAAFTVLNRLDPEQRRRGAAISSSGNFAAAWSYMGRLLGVPVAVVMQEKTSPFKLENTRRYGAECVLCANDTDSRWRTLFALESERGMKAVNTFEDYDVIRGHGTIGVELMEQMPDVDTVLIPVSSGGLIAGMATAIKAISPRTKVIGIQPDGSPAAYESFLRREVVRSPEPKTICDALIAAFPGKLPLAHMLANVDEMCLVAEDDVKRAVRWLAEHSKLVVEAGGAVGVAALMTERCRALGRTVVLLSGGNIHSETLAEYLRFE